MKISTGSVSRHPGAYHPLATVLVAAVSVKGLCLVMPWSLCVRLTLLLPARTPHRSILSIELLRRSRLPIVRSRRSQRRPRTSMSGIIHVHRGLVVRRGQSSDLWGMCWWRRRSTLLPLTLQPCRRRGGRRRRWHAPHRPVNRRSLKSLMLVEAHELLLHGLPKRWCGAQQHHPCL